MPRGQRDLRLAEVLREVREERSMAQEAVAFRAGISTGALTRLELGLVSPSWVTVVRVCDALELELAELGSRVASRGALEAGTSTTV
jgi:transcriptional regulator with XRE-family HTH domain